MRVLILGATGLVGTKVLDLMLQDNSVKRINILTRRSCGVEHQKITEYITSLDRMHDKEEAFDVDVCFCCLGTTIKKAKSKEVFKKVDYGYPLKAANLSKRRGVSHFILVSALGANSESGVFYNKVKGELEQAIKLLNLPKLSIIRPSLIIGRREERRPGEALAMIGFKILKPLFIGPLRKYAGSKVGEIASLMASLAKGTLYSGDIEFENFTNES